jgi:GT2 family glycosyltransferase
VNRHGGTCWSFDVEVEVAPPSDRVLFWIDLPIAGMKLYGDQLEVAGWAFGVEDSVAAFEVNVNGHTTARLTPQPRADVAAAYPQIPHAGRSGFAHLASIPPAAQTEVGVSIMLASGRFHAATIRLAGRSHARSSVNAPLVSVVIPCYNQGRFLREALASVARQTYPRVELIVVDDGSTDDTSAVAASCGVRCIRQENRGVSAARNRGAAAATGEFVVFLDADDRLLPHGLEANVDAFAERPEVALVSGWYRHLTPTGEPVPWSSPPLTPPERNHYVAFLESSYYIACPAQAMFRRDMLLAANGFDESYTAAEDYELYLRMAREHPISLHSVPVAEYRRHPEGVSTDSALVLESELAVLRAQRTWVRRDPSLRAAYGRGIALCVDFYGKQVALDLRNAMREREWRAAFIAASVLARAYPRGLVHAIRSPAR